MTRTLFLFLRLTLPQKEVLTDFLASHIECALDCPLQISDPEENSKVNFLWMELTHKLNSVDGPSKSVSGWQDVRIFAWKRIRCLVNFS